MSKEVKKKKSKLRKKETIFLDDSSSDSDLSVGSFFLKRSADMKKAESNCSSASKKRPSEVVVTPDMSIVHGRPGATSPEAYDNSRQDTTETSRMMDITRLKRTWTKVVDLTGTSGELELPGPTLADMKEQNNVFWTYDLRGVPTSDIDTAYFCPECKCPYHYCAKITYGEVVTRQVEWLLKNNPPSHLTYDWLDLKFRGVYWNCVYHKMLFNNIPFPDGYHFPSFGLLPTCIEKKYLRKLFNKYGERCDKNRHRTHVPA
jgi:hypothetical protein